LASSTLAEASTIGPCSRAAWVTGISESRLSPRSSPRKDATKSLAGSRRIAAGGVVLLEDPADVEDRDAVAELDRLVDVVGDEHDGLVQLALQVEQLVLQPAPHQGSTAP
jgi:hypothetical protein